MKIGKKLIEEMLMDKDIKKLIMEEFSKQIVGEEKSIDTILTCCLGSKVKNAKLSSFNLLVNDESSIGKDWVVGHVLKLFPAYMREHLTRISETGFTYWHTKESDPEWSWFGKVLHLEDPTNAILNSPVLKLMASSGSKAVITIKHKAREVEIVGKPVIISTMAWSNPNEEIRNRFNILTLDSGIDQTKAIMKRQTEIAKTGKYPEYDELITDCLGYLKRMPVLLPFLDHKKVEKMLPHTSIMRRQYDRFLDYVKAQTILFQLQRKKYQLLPTSEKYLIATKQDWNDAIDPFMKTVTNPRFIPLTKNEQKLLSIIEKLGDQLNYFSDIDAKQTMFTTRHLYRVLKRLAYLGFLEQAKIPKELSRKDVFAYRFMKEQKIVIKKW